MHTTSSARPATARLGAVVLGLALHTACGDTSSDGGAPEASPEAPAASWSGEALPSTSEDRALVLDRMEGTYDLPASNRAAGDDDSDVWIFDEVLERGDVSGKIYAVPLPFRIPEGQRRFKPRTMRVLVGDEELEFSTSPAKATTRRPTWRIHQDEVWITHPDPVTSVRIENAEVVRKLRRMSWKASQADGLSEAEFVQFGVTLGDQSREGLLLPAPATASWDVTVPEAATFRTWLTLAPSALAQGSDGAAVSAHLIVGDETIDLGRKPVTDSGDRFDPWTLDLSAHAGKTGRFELRSHVEGTRDEDYVFLGSPQIVGEPEGTVRRVVVVGIDTLRPDHLGFHGYARDTSPKLDQWVKDEAVVFDRAWTSAPRTRPSFRAATTGRLPLEAVCSKNIGAVFDEAGFATAGIVSNIHLNARFDFHKGFDFWWLDGKAKVVDQVERAKDFLSDHAQRDSYLFLHIMDPHIFYIAPEPYGSRYTSTLPPLPDDDPLKDKIQRRYNRSNVYQWIASGKLSDLAKQHIEAQYDAEVRYTDDVLGDFLDWLETLPGETVVVLHSDHGEELFEHGGFEHNHTLYDDTTRALLVVRPPGGTGGDGPLRSDHPATLQDIGPTVYELAGLTGAETDGLSLVGAMRGARADDRPIPIAHLRYDVDQWGVVWNDRKYILTTGTGREELYDLKADPGETADLVGQVDTAPWVEKLGASHGVDVGPGWRVQIDLPPGTPFKIGLPQPARGAGVLDPEYVAKHRVNKVWGEVPPKLPDDVARAVQLTDDGRAVAGVAGPKGNGIVWVRFDAPADPAGITIQVGEDAATVEAADAPVTVGKARFTVQPGIVLVPPPDEADRMLACTAERLGDADGEDAEVEEVSADDEAMLRSLGYIGDDPVDDAHD